MFGKLAGLMLAPIDSFILQTAKLEDCRPAVVFLGLKTLI